MEGEHIMKRFIISAAVLRLRAPFLVSSAGSGRRHRRPSPDASRPTATRCRRPCREGREAAGARSRARHPRLGLAFATSTNANFATKAAKDLRRRHGEQEPQAQLARPGGFDSTIRRRAGTMTSASTPSGATSLSTRSAPGTPAIGERRADRRSRHGLQPYTPGSRSEHRQYREHDPLESPAANGQWRVQAGRVQPRHAHGWHRGCG